MDILFTTIITLLRLITSTTVGVAISLNILGGIPDSCNLTVFFVAASTSISVDWIISALLPRLTRP